MDEFRIDDFKMDDFKIIEEIEPSGTFRARVMARVMESISASAKRAYAPAAVKYASMAACFVLAVCGAFSVFGLIGRNGGNKEQAGDGANYASYGRRYDMGAAAPAEPFAAEAGTGGAMAESGAAGGFITDNMTGGETEAAQYSGDYPGGSAVISSINITIKSDDFERTVAQAEDIGYTVIYDSINRYGKDAGEADVSLAISDVGYESAVSAVKSLGDVTGYDEYRNNVTGEVSDNATRLNAKKKEMNRLLELLAKAENVEDMLTVEYRLSAVTDSIEHYAGQLRYLTENVETPTINIHIYSEPVLEAAAEPTLSERVYAAFTGGLGWLGQIAEGAAYAAVPIIVIGAGGAAAAVIIFVLRRRRK